MQAADDGVDVASDGASTPGRGRWRRRLLIVVSAGVILVAAPVAFVALRIQSVGETQRVTGSVDIPAVAVEEAARDGIVNRQGDDFAYNVGGGRIVVCDQERDGRSVRVEYELTVGGVQELYDVSERPEDCVALDVDHPVLNHRVCEAHLIWTCSNWQATDVTASP